MSIHTFITIKKIFLLRWKFQICIYAPRGTELINKNIITKNIYKNVPLRFYTYSCTRILETHGTATANPNGRGDAWLDALETMVSRWKVNTWGWKGIFVWSVRVSNPSENLHNCCENRSLQHRLAPLDQTTRYSTRVSATLWQGRVRLPRWKEADIFCFCILLRARGMLCSVLLLKGYSNRGYLEGEAPTSSRRYAGNALPLLETETRFLSSHSSWGIKTWER